MTYFDGDGPIKYKDGKTAIAQRNLNDNGKLIWCGVPPFLDIPMLKGWLKESGVHFYGPMYSYAYSSKELVAVTWVGENEKVLDLNWPQSSTITDLFDNWTGNGKTIPCPFQPGQTRLFSVQKINGK